MEIYLVGGAVRDQLLGLPVIERDWVVIGATPELMLQLGYQPVGKDFPVFLHPVTHEEYALARTERKTAPGYKGFHFYAAPDVSLEEDLQRRDLTINAMAQTMEGGLIDPYGGQADLEQRILRHVSAAFVEDPVRILRVARLAARFPDFSIHSDTLYLMQQMVQQGEVNALVPERVWQEWVRAMRESTPSRFFHVLTACGALAILFPQLWENRVDEVALKQAVTLSCSAKIRLAAYLHHLPPHQISALSQQYRFPRDYTELALLVSRYQTHFQQLLNSSAEELFKLLESLDAFRRPERLEQFSIACTAIYSESYLCQAERLRKSYAAAKSVDSAPLIQSGLSGIALGQALRKQRVQLIAASLRAAPT